MTNESGLVPIKAPLPGGETIRAFRFTFEDGSEKLLMRSGPEWAYEHLNDGLDWELDNEDTLG